MRVRCDVAEIPHPIQNQALPINRDARNTARPRATQNAFATRFQEMIQSGQLGTKGTCEMAYRPWRVTTRRHVPDGIWFQNLVNPWLRDTSKPLRRNSSSPVEPRAPLRSRQLGVPAAGRPCEGAGSAVRVTRLATKAHDPSGGSVEGALKGPGRSAHLRRSVHGMSPIRALPLIGGLHRANTNAEGSGGAHLAIRQHRRLILGPGWLRACRENNTQRRDQDRGHRGGKSNRSLQHLMSLSSFAPKPRRVGP